MFTAYASPYVYANVRVSYSDSKRASFFLRHHPLSSPLYTLHCYVMATLPPVADRFLRYVQIDTQSDASSGATPSTDKQKDLGRLLVRELHEMGLDNACMDEHGYVYAHMPSVGSAARTPTVALLAHMDTSPDAPGANVKPIVHENYQGGRLVLDEAAGVVLDPCEQPALSDHIGHDLITSDGSTLLGSDDKAGVAIIMQLAADLLAHPDHPRPALALCFTVDEEIGRGVDHLDLDTLGADIAYTLDGGGVDTLYAETFNAAKATLTVRGVMVHPGYAKDKMVNAVRIIADFVASLPSAETPEHTEAREGYIHAHTLTAGDAAEASVELILRDFTDDGLERRKALVRRLVAFARTKYPRARFQLNITDQYKNMRHYIEASDPRAVTFAHAAAREAGLTLTDALVRGGTDGARLSEKGVPTPNVFTGGHDFHSRFEWNSVQNLERALHYTKSLVRYWAEHGASST